MVPWPLCWAMIGQWQWNGAEKSRTLGEANPKNGATQHLTEGFKLRSQPRDSHLLDLGQTKAKSASDGTKGVTLCHRMDGWLMATAWPPWAQSQKHTNRTWLSRSVCSCSSSCRGVTDLSSGNLPHLWGHWEGHLVGNKQQTNQCGFVLIK